MNTTPQQSHEPQAAFSFPEDRPVELCSYYLCGRGHRWKPKVATATCGGCGGPVVMVMVQNCPLCNEPIEKLVLRTDHIPNGGGVAKRCCGEEGAGDSVVVEMERRAWEEVEQMTIDNLEARQ